MAHNAISEIYKRISDTTHRYYNAKKKLVKLNDARMLTMAKILRLENEIKELKELTK